jgi:hypothetical protein
MVFNLRGQPLQAYGRTITIMYSWQLRFWQGFADSVHVDFLIRSDMILWRFPENLKVRFAISAFSPIYRGDKIQGL